MKIFYIQKDKIFTHAQNFIINIMYIINSFDSFLLI